MEAGTLKQVGTDEEVIYRESAKLLDDKAAYRAMAYAVNPYGDGRACESKRMLEKRICLMELLSCHYFA